MKLIGPLVLLALVSLVEGRVISFETCPNFFPNVGDTRYYPTILKEQQNTGRYKQICQQHKNRATEYRYATLYDTNNRIPVYSAYLYKGDKITQRNPYWMIEPQLDLTEGPAEMSSEADAGGVVGAHQAVDADYKDSGYARGHVYPNDHAYTQEQADSTFTLTNVAPQVQSYNQAWTQAEADIIRSIKSKCNLNEHSSKNIVHVVVGVTPGSKKMKNKVNVPSHYWSAFCCRDVKDQNKFVSGGYMMEMKDEAQLTKPTVGQLNTLLKNKYGNVNFKVFGTLSGCS